MDVGGYRHNYEDFYEKISYQMSINRGGRPQLKVPMQALWEFYPFFSFSLGEKFSRGDPTIQRPCGYR